MELLTDSSPEVNTSYLLKIGLSPAKVKILKLYPRVRRFRVPEDQTKKTVIPVKPRRPLPENGGQDIELTASERDMKIFRSHPRRRRSPLILIAENDAFEFDCDNADDEKDDPIIEKRLQVVDEAEHSRFKRIKLGTRGWRSDQTENTPTKKNWRVRFNAPLRIKLPVRVDEPAINNEPVMNEEPAMNEEPVMNEEPAMNNEPPMNDKPVINEEPVMNNVQGRVRRPRRAALTKVIDGPNPPPPMREAIRARIEDELNGYGLELLLQRKVYTSDLAKEQNRFTVPQKNLESLTFLTKEERARLANEAIPPAVNNNMKVRLIDPRMEETDMTFKQWNLRTSSSYVFNNEWRKVINKNILRENRIVQLWFFRDQDARPCFALDML